MPLSGAHTSATPKRPAENGRQSLADRAYTAMYRNIVSLSYEPGHPLEENLLVERLGIGRTPVREALLRLAADLLVESSPGKGFTVRPITIQNTKAAFDALLILELGVADLAVRQDASSYFISMEAANTDVARAIKETNILELVEANNLFHTHYAACSRNLYLMQALEKVRGEANRLAYLSYGNEIDRERSLKDHYDSVVTQHAQMIEYIRSRDGAGLKAVIKEHIHTFKNRMIRYLTA